MIIRDPKRISQILTALEADWCSDPDFRLGQLMVVAANLSGRKVICPEIFSLNDEDMLRGIEELIARNGNSKS